MQPFFKILHNPGFTEPTLPEVFSSNLESPASTEEQKGSWIPWEKESYHYMAAATLVCKNNNKKNKNVLKDL